MFMTTSPFTCRKLFTFSYYMYLSCVWVCVNLCPGMCQKARGQPEEVSSLFLPHGPCLGCNHAYSLNHLTGPSVEIFTSNMSARWRTQTLFLVMVKASEALLLGGHDLLQELTCETLPVDRRSSISE